MTPCLVNSKGKGVANCALVIRPKLSSLLITMNKQIMLRTVYVALFSFVYDFTKNVYIHYFLKVNGQRACFMVSEFQGGITIHRSTKSTKCGAINNNFSVEIIF